ncbi:MAG: hypothetical protein ACRD4O_10035 [Bryobacteraceae bacterium]
MLAPLLLAVAITGGGQSDPRTAGLRAIHRSSQRRPQQIFAALAAHDPKSYSALFNLALAGVEREENAPEEASR